MPTKKDLEEEIAFLERDRLEAAEREAAYAPVVTPEEDGEIVVIKRASPPPTNPAGSGEGERKMTSNETSNGRNLSWSNLLLSIIAFIALVLITTSVLFGEPIDLNNWRNNDQTIDTANNDQAVINALSSRLAMLENGVNQQPAVDNQQVVVTTIGDPGNSGNTQVYTTNHMAATTWCPGIGNVAFEWAAAGPAPQTKNEAAALLQADPRDLTILTYPCPGNEMAIGWVLGTTDTERQGKIQTAGNVPADVCVDYDEGPSQVYGDLMHHQKFDPRNDRSLLASNGSARGLKFSFYWTPCVFTDGFGSMEPTSATNVDPVAQAPIDQSQQPSGGFECPLGNPNAFINATVTSHKAQINTGRLGSNGYLLTSSKSFTVTRPNAHWILHTPNHPGNPGLTNGKETLTQVSVYCES